nr:MAG TPA: hypothetical protein [Bacteriophage sp.]
MPLHYLKQWLSTYGADYVLDTNCRNYCRHIFINNINNIF